MGAERLKAKGEIKVECEHKSQVEPKSPTGQADRTVLMKVSVIFGPPQLDPIYLSGHVQLLGDWFDQDTGVALEP